MFRFYYFFDWKECLLPDMLKTEMFNMAIKTSMQWFHLNWRNSCIYTFIQVTHVHMYRLQSDTIKLPTPDHEASCCEVFSRGRCFGHLIMIDPPCTCHHLSIPCYTVTDGHSACFIQTLWRNRLTCIKINDKRFNSHLPLMCIQTCTLMYMYMYKLNATATYTNLGNILQNKILAVNF